MPNPIAQPPCNHPFSRSSRSSNRAPDHRQAMALPAGLTSASRLRTALPRYGHLLAVEWRRSLPLRFCRRPPPVRRQAVGGWMTCWRLLLAGKKTALPRVIRSHDQTQPSKPFGDP